MSIKTIKPEELKRNIAEGNVVLIDVRELGEHQTECIEQSCLIPLGELCLSKLPTTSVPIVIHCKSGRRSEIACQQLLKENPDLEVYNLEGGIDAWKAAGEPIKTYGRKVLPLDRQTQIAVGFLVVLGVVLGTWMHPGFYVLSGGIGIGLINSGITGWCGMMKLIAEMPWNK